jgi:hypothetical protein
MSVAFPDSATFRPSWCIALVLRETIISGHGTLVAVCLTLVLMFAPARATADPIPLEGFGPFPFGPGDILRADFDVRPLLDSASSNDVLVFSPGVSVVEPVASYTTRVYDRGLLLGTYSSTATDGDASLRFRSWFAAPGSIFTFGDPTHMDFTTLQDRTFDGWVEFEISSGRVNLFRVSDELDFDRALTPDVASGSGFAPRTYGLIPAATPVPEPATLLLVGSGLMITRLRRRTRL